jgi:hypothetical protein
MQINPAKLGEIALTAKRAAIAKGGKDANRWKNAIDKAFEQLVENPYITLDGDALLVLSPSNEIYRANGTCQCLAHSKFGTPCWHRAAYKLVKRYNEASH